MLRKVTKRSLKLKQKLSLVLFFLWVSDIVVLKANHIMHKAVTKRYYQFITEVLFRFQKYKDCKLDKPRSLRTT